MGIYGQQEFVLGCMNGRAPWVVKRGATVLISARIMQILPLEDKYEHFHVEAKSPGQQWANG